MINKLISESAKVFPSGATIGILGGGQLGRMMTLSGTAMGYRFITLEPTENSPCGQVARQIVAGYDDQNAARQLAEECDVITYEFENVDAEVAALLENEAYVPQGSRLLYTTQHRLREKRAIEAAGVPVAPYREITSAEDMSAAVEALGVPCVLKTVTGGYDGKGQRVIRDREAALEAYEELASLGTELVLEQFVAFNCEISVIAARNPQGEIRTFPPAENVHVNNILHTSVVPARVSSELQLEAQQLAAKIAESMGAVGLLAVEMFVTRDGQLYVNELAPRPHNSGHYTMEACSTSQFEQHVRAICGLPLADTCLLSPVVMVNVLGEHIEAVIDRFAKKDSDADELGIVPKLHLYGKAEAKTGRKMGHINLLCHDVQHALDWIDKTNIWRNE
ncbi:5-(carboxyamino)imidazole ribonucleotide synthase [Paenibacillus urinalis]|uniref:N5-carboxyaminoimidazole ribonucleotide synthase n=1 Tax=Paenibacillus urinalis TaxID=521520 RepID=A0ABY7XE67_9BACL|nr:MULTISPECIES: 5-(carboxyamino)imidazole ribonucleotide synthase [Paenibacillus]WDH99318.1 5-(carboxyamino)imidazole ribonucleotide synthase [Paenibacillus urinalis]WDI03011.1 5-(carboxyamino)imidazole ribonucleotide synthase [Paenibacillus urinalis]GAK41698.1 phosphoribosylaminoimidazole carboxylase ATPase subunit [Paenibacillus sp. TCA20]